MSVSVSVLGLVGVTETPEETLLLLLLLQLLVGKLTCQLLGWKVLSAPAWTHRLSPEPRTSRPFGRRAGRCLLQEAGLGLKLHCRIVTAEPPAGHPEDPASQLPSTERGCTGGFCHLQRQE